MQVNIPQIIHELFQQKVDADTSLWDEWFFDSFAFLRLVDRLEKEFHLKLVLEDLEPDDWESPAKIADFLKLKLEV